MRLVKVGTWIVLLALSAPAVHAGKLHVGASVGQSDSTDLTFAALDDGSMPAGSVDRTDTAWKLFVGYRAMKVLAVEIDYRDYGQVSFDGTSDGSGSAYAAGPVGGTGDLNAWGVTAVGMLPLGKVRLFARGGIAIWERETMIVHSGNQRLRRSDDGTDPLYGFGLSWDHPGPGSVRLEFERIEAADETIHAITAGVDFRF